MSYKIYYLKPSRWWQVIRVWDQDVCFYVVSGSSHVVAHMMATGGLHGR